jgi:CheY-like chemotaxis protein
VAIIEDNEDNQLLLEVLLSERYALRPYRDGASALAGLLREPPDVALLDISLPGMDGLEVLAQIRESPLLRTLPVVALTAHAMEGDRERLLKQGFDDYISKPILSENLLFEAIDRLLREQPRLGD